MDIDACGREHRDLAVPACVHLCSIGQRSRQGFRATSRTSGGRVRRTTAPMERSATFPRRHRGQRPGPGRPGAGGRRDPRTRGVDDVLPGSRRRRLAPRRAGRRPSRRGRSDGHGPVADILPLVVHASHDMPYLLVEAGRDGGDLSLHGASRSGVAWEAHGDDLHLSKVRGGGWSHRRLQAHTEEMWRRNAADLVESVTKLWAGRCLRLWCWPATCERARRFAGVCPTTSPTPSWRWTATPWRRGEPSRRAVDDTIGHELDRLAVAEERDALDELATQRDRGDAAVACGPPSPRCARPGLVCCSSTPRSPSRAAGRPRGSSLDRPARGRRRPPRRSNGQTAPDIGVLRAAALTAAAVLVVEAGHLPDDAGTAALVRWRTP